ncbi:hypothetical protein [Alteromonas phage PB15]|nr:hypothetical protein [Alteromonas phage PB15]
MDDNALTRIEDKLEHQGNKMERLTEAISELAKILAGKEVRDHHIEEAVKEIKTDVNKLKDKVGSLEKINAGDDTMRKVFWLVLSVVAVAVIGGVLTLVIPK